MSQTTRLKIFREDHNFAAAHFLPEMGKCERLHGHNYYVSVEISAAPGPDNTVIDFNSINPLIKRICDGLDHRILLARDDKRIGLIVTEREIEAVVGSKRFVFPREDCVILPLPATTVELLAAHVCGLLAGELSVMIAGLEWVEAGVKEGASQMALHRVDMGKMVK
ncbi:MAG: 6-carboxytetrahydropterin synthase [Nitrospinae bacterium]|nr:6-carboxytetrahydropterin synthase [Nitrospinota bacterium]MBF0634566.1 6-carboxytetrahydropterin synthase [Nitrospinota bacterium]